MSNSAPNHPAQPAFLARSTVARRISRRIRKNGWSTCSNPTPRFSLLPSTEKLANKDNGIRGKLYATSDSKNNLFAIRLGGGLGFQPHLCYAAILVNQADKQSSFYEKNIPKTVGEIQTNFLNRKIDTCCFQKNNGSGVEKKNSSKSYIPFRSTGCPIETKKE